MKAATLAVVLHVLALSLSATAHALRREKFTAWYPLVSTRTFAHISTVNCSDSLANYRIAFREGASLKELGIVCSIHQQCIIKKLPEDIAARLQSANVLLGLTPVLLGQLGPSVAEISLLSRERPILALLLSVGSPSIFIDRVLKYKGAEEVLKDSHARVTTFSTLSKKKSLLLRLSITVVQYILAAVALANVIQTSLELGMRTTIAFSCNNWYWPLTWALSSFIVHLLAAVNWDPLVQFISCSFYYLFGKRNRPQRPEQSEQSQRLQTDENFFIAALKKETSLCLVHKQSGRMREPQPIANVVMNYVTTFIGVLHLTFGTLIFSSITFIEIADVFTVILRYMASAIICLAVLSFELAGIRHVASENEQRRTEATGYGSTETELLRRQDWSSAQVSQMTSQWEEETER